MEYVNFRPWVGKNYKTTGYKGKRILILGESHYCGNLSEGKCPLCSRDYMQADCHSFTENVVFDYVYHYRGESYEQTFLCFERAIIGKKLSQEEREDFWESVIFYNYLQFSQSGPHRKLQQVNWEHSELAFKELLEFYLPDLIIVWGARLYNDVLPNWGGVGSKLYINENDCTDIWTYTIKGKNIPAMKVLHPSSPQGKCWPFWHEFHKKFLNLEKMNS